MDQTPGSSRQLSRRTLLGAGTLGATAWTLNRSTGMLGWLAGIDAADASPPTVDMADTTDTGSAAVDALVAPGAIRQLVFTPPGATVAFSGLLVRPAAEQRSTAIVLVHGGGATGGGQGDSQAWATWYQDHGYLTFSIDYRLVDPAVDRGIYPLPEQNTKAAVQFLRQHADELGIERIVVQGHSAGARLGAILVTTADLPAFSGPDRWEGVSDRVDGFIGFYGYYDGIQYQPVPYYGGDGTAPSTAVSTRRADQVTGPIYLLHGDADSIVGVNRTQAFADALHAVGADVVLEVVPGLDHGYDGYGSAELSQKGIDTASRLVSWLERQT